jgi:hypothetical protein
MNIKNIIEKLHNTYQYIIVTEHIPENEFISNVDISSGNETRIRMNSGIVLNKPNTSNWRFLNNGNL